MLKEKLQYYCDLVEKEFNKIIPEENCNYASVIDAMRYSFLLGGKRIRPAILMEFYSLCGKKDQNALPFAVALEMIHTYSLIHDDLPCMDNDDMRRGKPANHIKFGEDIALLAGDGLLTSAFNVASNVNNLEPKNCLKAIGVLSSLAGYRGMIGGQVIDLQSEGKSVGIEVIDELNLLKTGGLLRAAAMIGAILAGADDITVSYADGFGRKLGLAFQIVDDILDTVGDSAVLGKPVASDQKNLKSTYVSVYGIERCREIVEHLTDEAIECLEKIGGNIEFLKELTYFLSKRNY